MNYKILINESGVPVLVEWFESSKSIDFTQNPPKDITKEFNERMLQAALADKSKHIAFKDVKQARNEAIQECIEIVEKELLDTDDHAGYVACDNIAQILRKLKK